MTKKKYQYISSLILYAMAGGNNAIASFPTYEEGSSYRPDNNRYYYIPQVLSDKGYEYDYDYDTEKETRIKIPERFLPSKNNDNEISEDLRNADFNELLSMAAKKTAGPNEHFYLKNLGDRVNIGRVFENPEDKVRIREDVKQKILIFLQNTD